MFKWVQKIEEKKGLEWAKERNIWAEVAGHEEQMDLGLKGGCQVRRMRTVRKRVREELRGGATRERNTKIRSGAGKEGRVW